MPKTNLKQQVVTLIEQLPIEKLSAAIEKLSAAIDYLTYLYDKAAWDATHELANDPEIVESLEHAEADVKASRLESWDDVKRDV